MRKQTGRVIASALVGLVAGGAGDGGYGGSSYDSQPSRPSNPNANEPPTDPMPPAPKAPDPPKKLETSDVDRQRLDELSQGTGCRTHSFDPDTPGVGGRWVR
jgi:hypothetical protein